MKDVFEVISIIVPIIFAIVKREEIWKAVKKIPDLWDKFVSTIDFPRRRLARRMNSEDFLAWQDRVLLKIYGENHFVDTLNRKYPVFCVDFNQDHIGAEQVDSLCRDDKGELLLNSEGRDVVLPDIFDTEIMKKGVSKDGLEAEAELSLKKELMGSGRWWKGYKWFTARSMRDGNHIGFVLDRLEMDGDKIKRIHLAVGSYKLTLLTSHILTYELFKAYEKLKKSGHDVDNMDIDTLWPMIPFRRYIHHVNGNSIDRVLYTGLGRYALLSVQCLVMLCTDVHNHVPEYKTFLLKRSDSTRDVSTKLGCYQFPPSGGFDLYDEKKHRELDAVRSNCSLYLALMREYLEEILNKKEYTEVEDVNGAFQRVRNDPHTVQFEKMFESDLDERSRARAGFKPGTKQAYFTTVGANIDLIDLRLSVNFLMVVNDIRYVDENADKFTPNEEYGWSLCKKKKWMLRSWDYVEEELNGKRKIVEDSVALYIQGKKAFDKYMDEIKV